MFRKAAEPAKPPVLQAAVTDTAPCQKSVRLHVGPDVIAPMRAAVLAEFQRQTTVPGFRKGKAPAEVIERQYAKPIQEETLQRLMKHAFEQAVQGHHLKPVGPFEVQTTHFSDTEGLSLEATVEVEPAFPLAAYKGIALTRRSAEVSPPEVDRALQNLRESMAQMVPSATGEAKERQVPTLDDELAKDLGFESLEKLTEHVGAKLQEQKRSAQREALHADLYEALLTRHTFHVPPRLVSHQTERLTREFTVRLLLSGVTEQDVPKQLEQFTEQLRTSAERHVKLGFILDRIAEQEAMTVTQDEVVKRLWQLAQRWKKDPAQVRRIFDDQGLWPSVVSSIRQEKTTALLLAAAVIENGAPPPASANPSR